MIPAILLAFREGLEAALILGIVVGVLNKMGQSSRTRAVWLGAGLAGALSVIGGIAFYSLGVAFEGAAEEIFEGFAMLLAAGVLTWMIFWMARQGGNVKAELEQDVREASSGNSDRPLFALAFLAVLREGIELALFLTAASFTTTATVTLIGGIVGLLLAALAGWLLFATTARLNLRVFFRVTSFLLILFAAGLVAHGVHEFNEVGWVPGVIEHVWDTNSVLDENSGMGEILKALLGYNGNPSLTEVTAYLSYWAVILLALWRGQKQQGRLPAGQTP
jgi:high-affinity iron transporter